MADLESSKHHNAVFQSMVKVIEDQISALYNKERDTVSKIDSLVKDTTGTNKV